MSHCMSKILFKSVQVSACYCKTFRGAHFFVDMVYKLHEAKKGKLPSKWSTHRNNFLVFESNSKK